MRNYKAVKQQVFQIDEYSLVPIRDEDRYLIMQWRNEQIYHLRQSESLTKELQDKYFDTVVANLFLQEKPDQILFSFLKNGECIGYGGLVHINWLDRNAEVSFVMSTELETHHFEVNWAIYLQLIEQVAFHELKLHKIFTYAFDLRKHLYPVLEESGFRREAILKDHYLFNGQFVDVLIHSKISRKLEFRKATLEDLEITFKWATDPLVRRYSISRSQITFDEHKEWFRRKINDPTCYYLLAEYSSSPIGSFRLDTINSNEAIISYLLDPAFHGLGLGSAMLQLGIDFAKNHSICSVLVGDVMEENIASIKIFESSGFSRRQRENELIRFELHIA